MNAIVDALWRAYRIRHIDMPATPERLWQAIAEGRRAQAGLMPNPIVGYAGEELSPRAFGQKSEHYVFAEQEVPLGGKLKKSRDIFARERAQAQAEAYQRGREDAVRARTETTPVEPAAPVEPVEPVPVTERSVPAQDPVLGSRRPEDR